MLTVDGSHGEGGGQVLRTALSLAAVRGQDVTIESIRAGRPKPGLQRQHLTCVRAVAELGAADVEGAEIGSQRVVIRPGTLEGGEFIFEVGSGAGSAMLILQTILPPLCFAPRPSRVTIRGGTHNPWAPPFDYIDRVFLPTVAQLGVRARASLRTAGWYPKGGGEIVLEVTPVTGLAAADWSDRGALEGVDFLCVRSNLPAHVAERQCSTARQRLADAGAPVHVMERELASIGPGTMSLAVARCRGGIAGFSALGERGKPAEKVALEACEALLRFLRSGAALDEHLADQVLLYAALADGETRFTTPSLTQHLLTNVWVIEQFLGERFGVEARPGDLGSLVARGAGYQSGRE